MVVVRVDSLAGHFQIKEITVATYETFKNDAGIGCKRLVLPGDGREWGRTLSGFTYHKFIAGEGGWLRAACRRTTSPHLHPTDEFITRETAERVAGSVHGYASMCRNCVKKDDAAQAEAVEPTDDYAIESLADGRYRLTGPTGRSFSYHSRESAEVARNYCLENAELAPISLPNALDSELTNAGSQAHNQTNHSPKDQSAKSDNGAMPETKPMRSPNMKKSLSGLAALATAVLLVGCSVEEPTTAPLETADAAPAEKEEAGTDSEEEKALPLEGEAKLGKSASVRISDVSRGVSSEYAAPADTPYAQFKITLKNNGDKAMDPAALMVACAYGESGETSEMVFDGDVGDIPTVKTLPGKSTTFSQACELPKDETELQIQVQSFEPDGTIVFQGDVK